MKKLVALFLSLGMLLGVLAFASAEEKTGEAKGLPVMSKSPSP